MQDRPIPTKLTQEPYSIRVSSRAKYMRLNVSLGKGLVVVVPKIMNQRQIDKLVPQFVRDKRQWIDNAFEKLRAEQLRIPTLANCQLPEQVPLKALQHRFMVDYCHSPDASMSLVQKDGYTLQIFGNLDHKTGVFELLERFFKDYARDYLKIRLDELSRATNLPYRNLTVRAQKTRWGSCSAKKNINLNYRLLFIDKDLLDYILLHELVHTIHMNHSKAFWSTLESLLPDARSRDKLVNQAAFTLPCWMYYN